MKKIDLIFTLVLFILLSFNSLSAQESIGNDQNPYAVGTYESAGIYWSTPESEDCTLRYKETAEESWKQGLDLVYDTRDGEYRGSIIGLQPDTEYEVELSTTSDQTQFTFRTRSDNFPIGKTTVLQEGESFEPMVITESGSPDAYHLVTVPDASKSVLNMKNVEDHGIEIDADYVIVRGIEIRNAKIHGIIIREYHP